MGFFKEEHAESGLADTASDGEGQLSVDQRLVEFELCAFGATTQVELAEQGFAVYPDAHGG